MRTVFLSEAGQAEIATWRRKLHAMPELSGEEIETAREVCALLAAAAPEVLARCEAGGLALRVGYNDIFDAVENAPEAVAHLGRALDAEGVAHAPGELPFHASEDFGRFGQTAPSAMVFLGAGESMPGLHSPDYDFPDALIPIASGVFMRTVRNILGAQDAAR
jgi:metal-dependent amidase/aminoacylase/carboxypeptidase family protein